MGGHPPIHGLHMARAGETENKEEVSLQEKLPLCSFYYATI